MKIDDFICSIPTSLLIYTYMGVDFRQYSCKYFWVADKKYCDVSKFKLEVDKFNLVSKRQIIKTDKDIYYGYLEYQYAIYPAFTKHELLSMLPKTYEYEGETYYKKQEFSDVSNLISYINKRENGSYMWFSENTEMKALENAVSHFAKETSKLLKEADCVGV